MYKKGIYKILANEPLTATVWRMVLGGDTQWITAPGQFVDIALEGRYLRRPISVCDYDATTLTLIYKVVGEGTAQMSRMAAGGELDLLTGLGNGFDVHNAADEVFYADEFRALGCDVDLATADGSAGVRGFVTTAIAECRPEFDYFYACGPLPMLRALCDAVQQDGQLSFEERMGCGFGACMGCSCKTKYGNKRICKEGPVLTKGEVIW